MIRSLPQGVPSFTYEALHREFASLPEEEQRKIVRERYGLEPEIEETPEFVSYKLRCFENALESIVRKEAYETALFIIPDHVESDQFRLAFLRADDFDAEAAATRMVNYWERKVELFGTDRAFKPYISLLDFDEDDYETLVKGFHRLLPYQDAHGRAILFNYGVYIVGNAKSMLKLVWWSNHKAVFDINSGEETQKKGVISVGGNSVVSDYSRFLTMFKPALQDALYALPIKPIAIHRFNPNIFYNISFEYCLRDLGRKLRSKLYLHNSTDPGFTAINLLSCGITPEILPWQLGGAFDFNYQQWLENCLVEDLHEGDQRNAAGEVEQRIAGFETLRRLLHFNRQAEIDEYMSILAHHSIGSRG